MAKLPHFLYHRLNRKAIFLCNDMWGSITSSWKESHALAQEYSLLAFDLLSIMELRRFILETKLYKLNIGMHEPLWRDWSYFV